ncbi:MAG: sulfite exporter TauE/SafE family protein [Bacteroidia bacterium]|jgi:hypothetical protein|nr:sulfite exporter TauE/SafE family protein [Bacteroidia bacterium]
MSAEVLIVFLLLALLAEVLGTLGGFGSSVFFVPIASYYFDFHTTLAITALFHVASNLFKIVLFKNGIEKKLLIQMGIPAVICVLVGSYLSIHLNAIWLEWVMATMLLVMAIVLLLKPKLQLPANTTTLVSGGSLSGLVAGLVGTGGAIRGLALASFRLAAPVFIATSAFIDLGVDMSRSVVYLVNGFATAQIVSIIPYLVLVSVVGNWIGKEILKHISATAFTRWVLVLVIATSLFTMGKLFFTTFVT